VKRREAKMINTMSGPFEEGAYSGFYRSLRRKKERAKQMLMREKRTMNR
jgi:hypothetical protein